MAAALLAAVSTCAGAADVEAEWAELQKFSEQSPPTNLSEEQELAWFTALQQRRADVAETFFRRHLQDPRRWSAGLDYVEALLFVGHSAPPPRVAEARALLEEIARNPDVPDAVRQRAASKIAQAAVGFTRSDAGRRTRDPAVVRRRLDELATWLPAGDWQVRMEEFYLTLLATHAPAVRDEWIEYLRRHANPAVAAWAEGLLEQKRAAAKPFEMRFTALDGRAVDLATLRGKVVLVDFWATWCGPCVAELPNVRSVYDRYQAHGFEVIGISLDRAADRAKLENFIRENALPWPQQFDGLAWKGDLVTRFAIRAIPAMFLLDQSGRLVTTDARGEKLEAEVKRLLRL